MCISHIDSTNLIPLAPRPPPQKKFLIHIQDFNEPVKLKHCVINNKYVSRQHQHMD